MFSVLRKIKTRILTLPAGLSRVTSRFLLILRLMFIYKRISAKNVLNNLNIYLRAGCLSIVLRLLRKSPLLPKPTILLGFSNICNVKCVFCHAHSNLIADKNNTMLEYAPHDKKHTIGNPDYLDINALKVIVDELEYLEPVSICLSGNGETLMYPYITEAVEYILSKDILKTNVVLFTNAVLLNGHISSKLLASGLPAINFSINAAKASTYAVLHCVNENIFNNVINNIRQFIKMQETSSKKPSLSASFVLNKQNYKEIPDMIELCQSLNIKKIGFRIMFYCKGSAGQLKDYIFDAPAKEDFERYILEAIHLAGKKKIYSNLKSLFNILKADSRDYFKPPVNNAYNLQIHADGIVNPYDYPEIMGNTYRDSIISIWYSPEYTKFRNRIKQVALKDSSLSNQHFCFRCNLAGKNEESCRIIY